MKGEKRMFAEILLGHLVGDYLLQGRTIAFRKSEKSRTGIFLCLLHSVIYTLSVCLFLWTLNPFIMLLIFLSHYPIDRWSLGSKWLKMIQGKDFRTIYDAKEKGWEIDLAFSCPVYMAVDNTMHLILLWLIVKYIYPLI